MKRFISWVLTAAMMLSMVTLPSFADWAQDSDKPVTSLVVEGVGEANPSALLAGQQVTVKIITSGLNKYWNSYQYQLNYDADKFTMVNSYPTCFNDVFGLFYNYPTPNANIPGEYAFTGASAMDITMFPSFSGYVKSGDTTNTYLRDITVLEVTFTVKDGVKGTADFSIETTKSATTTHYQVGFTAASGLSAVTTSTDDMSETVTIMATPMSSATVAITAPVKGVEPQSTITETDQYTGTITWTPAVSDKFAASTVYAATVTLTAKAGESFASAATATVEGATISDVVVGANGSTLTFTATFDATAKADAEAPTGLAEVSKTHDTITVTANDAWEYSINGGAWQDSNVFTGLNAATQYSIVARVKETNTHNASAASAPLSVTTEKAPAGEAVAPAVAAKTDSSITVTAVAGQKYSLDQTTWQDSGEFTGLNRNTEYTIYTYIPETDTTKASAVKSTTVKTEQTELDASAVTVDLADKTYTGNAIAPAVTIDGLTKDTDFEVAYSDNTDAGTATITITGKGDYKGTVTKTFEITACTVTITPNAASKTYGDADPTLTYATDLTNDALKADFEAAVSGTLARAEGENVGQYAIGLGSLTAGDNFSLQLADTAVVNLTISAKNVSDTGVAKTVTLVKTVGTFTDPTFDGATGTIAYSYDGMTEKSAIENALKVKAVGDYEVAYTFTANGNYTGTITGILTVSVKDIEFTFSGDAVTLKDAPVYGDTWAEIVTVNGGNISASVNGEDVPGTYSLQQTGSPNAGENQTYTVLFNSADGKYVNVEVTSGTVSVAKAAVTVPTAVTGLVYNGQEQTGVADGDLYSVTTGSATAAGNYTATVALDAPANYKWTEEFSGSIDWSIAKATVTVTANADTKVSKVYDGTTAAGELTGRLSFTGILDGDTVQIVPSIPAYTNANVGGQSTLELTIALDGTPEADDSANYQLASTTLTVPCEITKKDISFTATAEDKPYDETTAADATVSFAVLVDGEALALDTDYTVTAAFSDANAGTDKDVTVTVALKDTAKANNYNLTTATATAKADINKINYTEATPDGEAKYGNTGSVTLDIAPGATAAPQVSVSDADGVLDGTPTIVDGKLNFKFKDTAVVGKTATVQVSVSEGTNHNGYTIEVVLTVLDKYPQSEFGFAAAAQDKTYGDDKFIVEATGAAAGSIVTYSSSSSDETVATVNAETGEVTILKAGTVTITANASATDDYASASASYTLTVAKATITVKAIDQTIYVNGTYVIDETAYYATGLVGEDALGGEIVVKFYDGEGNEVTPDVTTTGTYTIKVSGATAPNENYESEITYEDGTLTIRRRSSGGGSSAPAPVEPEKCDGGKNCPAKPYTDVNTALWYHEAVDYALTKSFMVGLSDDTFGPEIPVSRAMVVTVLWSLEGKPTASASTFEDLADGAWYAKAVDWASSKGIVAGYSAESFGPDDLITREQMATILRAYAKFKGQDVSKANDLSAFADADQIADWAETAVAWANAEGLMAGRSATELAPKGTTKRAELAAMLMSFLEK